MSQVLAARSSYFDNNFVEQTHDPRNKPTAPGLPTTAATAFCAWMAEVREEEECLSSDIIDDGLSLPLGVYSSSISSSS